MNRQVVVRRHRTTLRRGVRVFGQLFHVDVFEDIGEIAVRRAPRRRLSVVQRHLTPSTIFVPDERFAAGFRYLQHPHGCVCVVKLVSGGVHRRWVKAPHRAQRQRRRLLESASPRRSSSRRTRSPHPARSSSRARPRARTPPSPSRETASGTTTRSNAARVVFIFSARAGADGAVPPKLKVVVEDDDDDAPSTATASRSTVCGVVSRVRGRRCFAYRPATFLALRSRSPSPSSVSSSTTSTSRIRTIARAGPPRLAFAAPRRRVDLPRRASRSRARASISRACDRSETRVAVPSVFFIKTFDDRLARGTRRRRPREPHASTRASRTPRARERTRNADARAIGARRTPVRCGARARCGAVSTTKPRGARDDANARAGERAARGGRAAPRWRCSSSSRASSSRSAVNR